MHVEQYSWASHCWSPWKQWQKRSGHHVHKQKRSGSETPALERSTFGSVFEKLLIGGQAFSISSGSVRICARSAGSRYDSLGSTRAAKKKICTRAAKKMHAGCRASLKKREVGNRASNAYKSFRTILLTGSWSHLVSRYADLDLRSRTGGFLFFFFFLIWEHPWPAVLRRIDLLHRDVHRRAAELLRIRWWLHVTHSDTAHHSWQATNV